MPGRIVARAIALAIAWFAAAGCHSGPVVERAEPISPPALAASIASSLERARLPASAPPPGRLAVHRAILTVAERQWDVDGYVVARAPDHLRLVAKGGLAGAAFDAVSIAGDGRVLKNAVGLEPRWIVEGALRDAALLHLRLEAPWPDGVAMRIAGGHALVRRRADGDREAFLFEAGDGERPTAYRVTRGDELRYEARFSHWRGCSAEWPAPVAQTVRITDPVLGYQLLLQVVTVRPAPAGDERFPDPGEGR